MPHYKAPLIDAHIPGAGWMCPIKNVPSGPGTRVSGELRPFFGKVRRVSVDRISETCVVETDGQVPGDWISI